MPKILLTAAIVALTWIGQVHAMTKPDDVIGVHIFNGIEAKDQAKYFKKWKDIKLSPETRAALLKKNTLIDKEEGYGVEKFKLHFLFLGEGKVTRVFFLGDSGSVIMMDWPNGQYCMLSFDSSSGFAGLLDKACR